MNARIKAIRKTVGLNQTEFGARIGVKQTTIAGYETGASTPMDAVISSICREFNVDERWLRTGEGEMFRARDRMDELMESAGRFFANETDEFRLRFAKMVFNWSDAEWEALYHYAQQLLSEDDRR